MNPILEQIKQIRTKNNDLWMEIVDLALRMAPHETKALLRDIRSNDEAVSRLNAQLAE